MYKIIFLVLIFIGVNACAQKKNKDTVPADFSTSLVNVNIDTNWKEKINFTDSEWKAKLTEKQYYILREHGTERPFSSDLYNVKDEGVYICAGCKNPLFSSEAKFDSGTGWPSFFKPFSSQSLNIAVDNSLGTVRDALSCKRCNGHLGHVFDDGPNPTGLRHCIDGDGLLFVPKQSPLSVATFAGGCFWCTETIFENLKGVKEVVSGYSGGKEMNPTYESVGNGLTGHAEAFQIYYDSTQISYKELVRAFFASIDPTTVDGQSPDFGKQYRTIAFYTHEKEKKIIDDYIAYIAKDYSNPIATQVVNFERFYEAEAYHQNFVRRNPKHSYVRSVSIPRRSNTFQKINDLINKDLSK